MSVLRGKAEEGTAQLPNDPEGQCCSGELLQSVLCCSPVLLRHFIKNNIKKDFRFVLCRTAELLEESVSAGVLPESSFTMFSL